ncbi:hypothetical protein KBY90_05405 [Cyanobium sp. CH-040]|nr:hypothetical protein [Cyanobium sp. CH-040]
MLAGAGLVPFAPAWAVGYGQDSRFPANPPLAHDSTERAARASQFGFDLRMDVEIDIGSGPKPARVFVNSRDGSMLLDQPTLTLWAFGAGDLINRVSVHHLLVDDGQALACGEPRDARTAAQAERLFASQRLCFGVGQLSPVINATNAEAARQIFFDNLLPSPPSPPSGKLPGAAQLEAVVGETPSGRLALWLEPGSSTIATRAPFLGPAVGVVKDPRVNRNRVVRHAWLHSPQNAGTLLPVDTFITLRVLQPATRTLALSGYQRVTAFTSGNPYSPGAQRGGLDQMQVLSRQLRDGLQQVELMDRNGNCRGAQELYSSLMARLAEFQGRHGLAADQPYRYRCRHGRAQPPSP